MGEDVWIAIKDGWVPPTVMWGELATAIEMSSPPHLQSQSLLKLIQYHICLSLVLLLLLIGTSHTEASNTPPSKISKPPATFRTNPPQNCGAPGSLDDYECPTLHESASATIGNYWYSGKIQEKRHHHTPDSSEGVRAFDRVLDGEDQRLLWEDAKVQACVSKLLLLKINIDNASAPVSLGIKKHMVKTRIYRFRQYGLRERYAKLYPDDDFDFKIGINDYQKDWFFAEILVNDVKANPPHFTTGLMARDNLIARHGIHGLYWLYNIDVLETQLVIEGDTIIFLTQPRSTSPFQGLMYDYIRLEEPPTSSPVKK
ncbi:hypothetical protein GIB67_038016 [Kingdonia uniflora]|uniref:Rhamnogalacturonan lyase domain-containing protein n=1 Tax=Kingdonia uniflora TaxID=39325 RepID=A0A7J7LHL8_9MAGN|nr:hypothetical protein GIB67_038016 [Kingdonia uniflora]